LTSDFSQASSIQDAINRINTNVSQISSLRARSFGAIDGSTDTAQLDAIVGETKNLLNDTKLRVKRLEADAATGDDANVKKDRARLVHNKFVEALQNYQRAEQEATHRAQQQIARQFRIVKPDATQEEVKQVVDGGGGQIFAEALSSSTRWSDSRTAYREVQERQEDLKKIEATLAELSQLFIDMDTIVGQQEDTINHVEQLAQEVEDQTKQGAGHTEKAVDSARRARRKRWICFWLTLILLAIIAIILAI
ncbi:t-SNARE, partial [Fistulina hepatica ATCC 64428]